MEKLYVVVRADLAPGLQAAQACHAAMEFVVARHPDLGRAWHRGSNNLVLLQVPDGAALRDLARQAGRHRIACAEFFEPDLDYAMTAIALGPDGGPLVGQLPLALRAAKPGLGMQTVQVAS